MQQASRRKTGLWIYVADPAIGRFSSRILHVALERCAEDCVLLRLPVPGLLGTDAGAVLPRLNRWNCLPISILSVG